MIKYLKLPFTFDVTEVRKEIDNLLDKHWQMHFNKRDYTGEWSVLPLISHEGKNTIFPKLYGEHGSKVYKSTEFLQQSPQLQHILSFFHLPITSARLMNLKVGAIIKEHTDLDLSFEDGVVRLHIPIQTNDNVRFYLEDELIPMKEGECWYLNFSLKHKIFNEGETDRIHLVIDADVNDWIKEQFSDPSVTVVKYHTEQKQDFDVNVKKQMIEHLKLQGTETALELAAKIEQEL